MGWGWGAATTAAEPAPKLSNEERPADPVGNVLQMYSLWLKYSCEVHHLPALLLIKSWAPEIRPVTGLKNPVAAPVNPIAAPFRPSFLPNTGNGTLTGTGTGTMIGCFFRVFTMATALAIFNALAALRPAILRAIVFLATRIGAVAKVNVALLTALI